MTTIAILSVVLTADAAVAHADDPGCVGCHRRARDPVLQSPVFELPDSVHGSADVGCVDCHGGRGDDRTATAHDPAAGFRPRPGPTVCGTCHDDDAPPADSHVSAPTAYATSAHGMAVAAGRDAATCASCHGAHDIVAVADPRSPVAPANVATACARCHSDRQVMNGSGLPVDQERLWLASVHGQLFHGSADSGAPTCSSCHDVHGAPRAEEAVRACGRCHEAERQAFDAGPHARLFERLGFVDCVECHGNHGVRRVDPARILGGPTAPCRRCHAEEGGASAPIEQHSEDVIAAERVARTLLTTDGADEEARADAVAVRQRLHAAIHRLDADAVGDATRDLLALAGPAEAAAADEAPPEEGVPYATLAFVVVAIGAVWLAWRRRKAGRP